MEGKCLCGSIEVIAGERHEVGLCHCTICRNWSGGPLFAVHCGNDVRFSGITPKRYKSSDWAERGFCSECGTHLFLHFLPKNAYILSAGLFQQQAFKLTSQMFIDEKPGFYEFKNETMLMTGEQIFTLLKSILK